MSPIGQSICTVMDIMRSPETCCKLEVRFDDSICGFLHIRAWKVRGCGLRRGLLLITMFVLV